MAPALFDEIAAGAAAESPLWAEALLPPERREEELVFSPLVPEERFALGVETIYEGYLLHYGRARLFAPPTTPWRSCSATPCSLTGSSGSPQPARWQL